MVTRDIIQRLLGIINDTRSRLNTLEAKEVALLTATQTLTNKTLTTPTIGDFSNAQHAHTNAASGGTISHGSLTGLTTGDPHTQYLLESTYDANTILKADSDDTPVALTVGASTIVGRASTGNITALTAGQVASIVQGSIDHGSITGLADDDHTGYARLAGRSGGQTLIGGTAANDDLTLEGTSNATRTTSYVVIQPNGGNVGIGTTSPGAILSIRTISLPTGTISTGANLTGKGILLQADGEGVDSKTGIFTRFSSSPGINAGMVMGRYGSNWGTYVAFHTHQDNILNLDEFAERMRIDGAGNVGIGTTSPGAILSVRTISLPTVTISTGANLTGKGILLQADGEGVDSKTGIFTRFSSSPGINAGMVMGRYGSNWGTYVAFHTHQDNILNLDEFAERMRIDGAGNVGIGTTSPDTRLDIDAGAIEFAEMTAPAAGAANTGRLFCRDMGGKTQLCVIFNTGAIQVIATEP